ncbi:hypothetical protein LAG90_19405 [Marinilongibacter aquaticus]|uniref:hypothetical protein n=1 Tax=Marinilongibacter aquaticus TaxID=2975157 RepID=UPI0021BD02F3|nr:hypothetical protein [Marinilongibacter aquaticus]UBM58969.1 hypothetical protein LAG90_19405 [Marinilongibacter aquaticus]
MVSHILLAQDKIAILPASSPRQLQVRVVSGNRVLSNESFITANDRKIEISAYSREGVLLDIPEVLVDIVRGGRKIASKKMKRNMEIDKMLADAQPGDIFRFVVPKVYIRNEKDEFELYSSGRMTFMYEYRP